MLKGVEEVCFIDSFVVDKKIFSKHTKSAPNPANFLCMTPTLKLQWQGWHCVRNRIGK